jgi:predicted nicotinamide N-methyase
MLGERLIEEVVPLRGGELAVLRPRDSEALLDEAAFEREELMPYWAELWPSGVALARTLAASSLRGRRVLELGCGGLALPSLVAARGGARVLATDWAPQALDLARENARRNGLDVEVARVAWSDAEDLVGRGPWDLVLGSDLLYERRNVAQLVDLLPRLGTEVWLADPGRPPFEEFLEAATAGWTVSVTGAREAPGVAVHRLRARG